MCLAVPGKLVEVTDAEDPAIGASGVVDFQGSRVTVNLAFTPEAKLGDWLLVHAGFAISLLDEDEAREVWDLLSHDALLAQQAPEELRVSEEGGVG